MAKKKKRKPYRARHKFWNWLGYHLLADILIGKNKADIEKFDIEEGGPYLIMANHTTEIDMAVMVKAMKKHAYFVAGEHLSRSTYGKFLLHCYGPILEQKGALAMNTIKEMVQYLRDGHSVMIFPEGSRSFNGYTEPVTLATGKMVKAAKCGMITYRIEGGYFIAPRWGYKFRTGPIRGRFVNRYSKEELAKLTAEEITAIIDRDLHENAYERQRQLMDEYTGENLAEGIENYLEICPACGAYDSFESKGDEFHCTKCGKGGIYNKYGFLEGEDLQFDSVYDWGKWMEGRFDEDQAKRPDDEVMFTDGDVRIYQITYDHKEIPIGPGVLKGYKDHFEILDFDFEFPNVVAMSMLYFGKTLLFTSGGKHYGITGEHFHAWKYNRLYTNFVKSRNN